MPRIYTEQRSDGLWQVVAEWDHWETVKAGPIETQERAEDVAEFLRDQIEQVLTLENAA